MASFNDIKTGNIVFNKVTEDLLKTMTIEPNQFYITPDDFDDTENPSVTPSIVADGKPWVEATSDESVSFVHWVNNELDLDLFRAQVMEAPADFDDFAPETIPIVFLWMYTEQVEAAQGSVINIIDTIVGAMSNWNYTNLNNWLSLDTFEPEYFMASKDYIIPNHIKNWCYIKINDSSIQWRKFADDVEGNKLCVFKFNFNGAVLTYVIMYNETDGFVGSVPLVNTTLINALSIESGLSNSNGDYASNSRVNAVESKIDNVIYNNTKISNSYGGAAIGSNASSTGSGIQLGTGTNTTNGTLQVFEYQLLNENGIIPNERLDIDLDFASNEDILAMIDEATPKVVDISAESLV